MELKKIKKLLNYRKTDESIYPTFISLNHVIELKIILSLCFKLNYMLTISHYLCICLLKIFLFFIKMS